MDIPIIAFFNNKGGVGKTTLVYHLACMYVELDLRVLAVDLDPQTNLSAMFLPEETLENFWSDEAPRKTIYGCLQPLIKGTGDIHNPYAETIPYGSSFLSDALKLIVGDLSLSRFEDNLSDAWPRCLGQDERSFRVTSAFWRMMQLAAQKHQSNVILLDLGPNLGSINRAALISADYVVIPLSPDLYSLQGLRNLGPMFKQWRKEWNERKSKNPAPQELKLPNASIKPIGYILMQHAVRLDRPVKAYDKWASRIPYEYRKYVLDEHDLNPLETSDLIPKNDSHCLALIKHYRSLMPLSQEARKPMFSLKSGDGAIGAHQAAALSAFNDFENLAKKIGQATSIFKK